MIQGQEYGNITCFFQNHGIILAVILVVLYYIVKVVVRRIKLKREFEHRCSFISSVTPLYRGTASERDLVFRLLNNGIPATTIFHDLLLEKVNGEYSQVDVVVPTKVGILAFEVKDYSG